MSLGWCVQTRRARGAVCRMADVIAAEALGNCMCPSGKDRSTGAPPPHVRGNASAAAGPASRPLAAAPRVHAPTPPAHAATALPPRSRLLPLAAPPTLDARGGGCCDCCCGCGGAALGPLAVLPACFAAPFATPFVTPFAAPFVAPLPAPIDAALTAASRSAGHAHHRRQLLDREVVRDGDEARVPHFVAVVERDARATQIDGRTDHVRVLQQPPRAIVDLVAHADLDDHLRERRSANVHTSVAVTSGGRLRALQGRRDMEGGTGKGATRKAPQKRHREGRQTQLGTVRAP
eukprot:360781-Chlamydomonas_euryale.AAC.1